jgi:hypothetical protein
MARAADYCTFSGMPCNAVKSNGLSLSNLNLSGTLPSSFPTLATLLATNTSSGGGAAGGGGGASGAVYLSTAIDFSYNELLRVDLSLFTSLINLTAVMLDSTHLVNDTLPAAVGSLTNLRMLSLTSSSLVGSIPDVFSDLTALTTLKAGSNMGLVGSVPPSLIGSASLQTLVLSGGGLTGTLPTAGFCTATSLSFVDLSANQLSGSLPEMGCLPGLMTYLDLKSNRLSGSIPADLALAFNCSMNGYGMQPYLQLGLSGNILQGAIPPSLLNLTCIHQISVLQPVSVCAAGQYSTGGVSASGGSTTDANRAAGAAERWLAAACEPCPNLTFSSAPGASACTPCQQGSVSNVNFTACEPCRPGTAMVSGLCRPCQGGTVSASGAVTCSQCGTNTYSNADLTFCLSCPSSSSSVAGSASLDNCTCAAGEVRSAVGDSVQCTACPVGTAFNDSTLQCTSCGAGFYSNALGARACMAVDLGFYSICSADGCTGQAPCPVGSFLNASSALAGCSLCPAGKFTASTGALGCADCPGGTIASAAGASACAVCPLNARDAQGHTMCLCAPGFFDSRFGANASDPACVACVQGGNCDADGLLLAQEGWWRESPEQTQFLKCRGGFCIAEDPPAAAFPHRRALRANASAPIGNCAKGHQGVLCAQCSDGWSMQAGLCVTCRASDSWSSWSGRSRALLIALSAPAGLIFICVAFMLPILPTFERAAENLTSLLANCVNSASNVASGIRRAAMRAAGADKPPVQLITATRTRRLSAGLSGKLGRQGSGLRTVRSFNGQRPAHSGPTGGVIQATSDAVPYLHSLSFASSTGDIDGDGEGDLGADQLMEAARSFVFAVLRPVKILINFFQIVSSFIGTLDVPWPRYFFVIMSRVNVVNINLVQLPRTGCRASPCLAMSAAPTSADAIRVAQCTPTPASTSPGRGTPWAPSARWRWSASYGSSGSTSSRRARCAVPARRTWRTACAASRRCACRAA